MNQKPCRIAFIIDDLSYGGAQRQLVLLAESLPELYVPVIYCISQLTDPFADMLEQKGIEVISFRRRSHLDPFRFFALLSELSRSKIDIIHGILDASNAYAFLAGRFLRKPTILSLRNDRLTIRGIKAGILHLMYRKCKKISTNSKAGKFYLMNTAGVAEEKIVLVRNLFPVDSITPQNSESSDRTVCCEDQVIGYVGRFSKQKNVGLLIHAFKEIIVNHPHAKLVLIGRGDKREYLRKLIHDLQLGERVVIREPLTEILQEIRRFKCLVLPSAHEGFPNVVIEALSVGTPVVVSEAGDVSELVLKDRTGICIAHPTAESLAAAISRILSEPEITKQARIEGPRLIRENFAPQVVIDKYLSLYDSFRDR